MNRFFLLETSLFRMLTIPLKYVFLHAHISYGIEITILETENIFYLLFYAIN